MVDEPGAGAYYGSIVAAPYGKMIFEKLFKYLNIPKDDENVKLEYVVMPNLIGLTLTDAIRQLNSLKLDCEIDGHGGIILEQLPPEGVKIPINTAVLLKT